jgi:type I restriction enzyme S subunit
MTKGWQKKSLSQVSAINYGYTESATAEPVGPRFLRITDIQNDSVDWQSVPYCPIADVDLPKYRLASGDIVFARTGATTGKSFLVNDPPSAVFASYLIRLRLTDQSLLPEFVTLFFQTADYWQSIRDGSSGSAQGGFNATKLGALTIPVPPLAEQQRIVGILDEAFEGIATAKANAEKNLQNAHALFESHLQSVFTRGPDEVPLSEVASDITDGDHSPPPKAPTGVPFITISDIVKRTRDVDFSNTFTVPEEYFQNLKPNKKPRVGDVLYTVTGATLGIPVLVKEQRDFCFQRHIGLIRPKPETDSAWLTYALLSPQVFRQATIGSTGAAQKTVSLSVLRNLKVPKLAIAEQKRIASRLDNLAAETQRLATIYERKLAALDDLKKSLLHQAFSGQLTGGAAGKEVAG